MPTFHAVMQWTLLALALIGALLAAVDVARSRDVVLRLKRRDTVCLLATIAACVYLPRELRADQSWGYWLLALSWLLMNTVELVLLRAQQDGE